MKKMILLVLSVFVLMGCEDFLDSENWTKKDTSNFPETSADALDALTAAYSILPSVHPNQCIFLVSEILSDDRLGGGSNADISWGAIDQLKKTSDNMFPEFWAQMYTGIYRCNMILETLDYVTEWDNEELKNKITAEARFLRAYFYFDLCRMFGTVPLVLTTEAVNNPRAEAAELYAQITTDLKYAIETLPARPYTPGDSESGHATKWAAESLMARVYLFYTGYYKQNDLPLTDGGSVSKQDVINWLDDCINNSGHGLVDNFGNLWPYSNPATAPDYKFAVDNQLNWVTDDNKETIFSIKYASISEDTNDRRNYSNQPVLYFSIRQQTDYENIFPFGQGWGAAPVSPNLIEDWKTNEPNDFRRNASVIDFNNNIELEGLTSYESAPDLIQETGLWQKKNIAINAHQMQQDGSVDCVNYSCLLYGRVPNFKVDNTQDQVIIRFADVLLMMAELKQDASYINLVRERAGLDPITGYTDDALRNERRWELAFEGVRYYDLLRWGIAGEALEKQNGVTVYNAGAEATMNYGNIARRIEETGGFMPIPQTQIDLSSGVLVQTPGWGSDSMYSGV